MNRDALIFATLYTILIAVSFYGGALTRHFIDKLKKQKAEQNE